MQGPKNFTPARSRVKRPDHARDAAEFLRHDDKLAALLPAARRFATLQRDCAAALPAMFDAVGILAFENGQLVLAVPNAALAARLKQQLPKLQETLLKRAWQVTAIRLKVQVRPDEVETAPPKVATLGKTGASAFAELEKSLENAGADKGLLAAVAGLVRRARGPKG